MVITPQTDVYLLQVPLEIDSNHQLTFANATAQFNYFFSLPKIGFDDFTYQRKDNSIRVPALFDDIMNYNYVMYRNDAYSNKWFYAYITDMTYKNDSNTEVYIKTDVWQTYQFELTFKPVLIDREHVNDDTVGKHTLPEGLELGEMVVNGGTTNFGGASEYYTVIEVSQLENEGENQNLSFEWDDGSTTRTVTPALNGISRGSTPLITNVPYGQYTGANADEVRATYEIAGLSDSILNIYIMPSSLIGSYHTVSIHGNNSTTYLSALHLGVPDASTNEISLGSFNFTKPSSVDNYIPKNNKVLTYPFCYFNISNNSGTSLPFRYEDFSTVTFSVEGTFGVSGNIKATPRNYLNIGTGNGLDYSITGAKYPVCSWKSDSYTNWLTQNAVNMQSQWTQAITNSLTTPSTFGLAGNLIATAYEQHVAKSNANLVPDQVHGNLSAGDFLWAKYRSPFTYLPMCIKKEYAIAIDQYFSQYGYKCNLVKVPNITGRRNWNYVKTVGCYIEANIPQEDLQEIKLMFDKGITLWHNPATFADYTQNNDII